MGSGILIGQDKEASKNQEQESQGVQSLNDKDNRDFMDQARRFGIRVTTS